jgi:hypothetical protein
VIELVALHSACVDRGMFDLTREIRSYIAFATHAAHSTPAVH